ncbi:MAG: FAD-dependent oxidoreductase [Candidatus Omnitrophota bacterium]
MSRVVIAGGGFAGVSALKTLAKTPENNKGEIEISLIDKKPYFEFLPMLPDVAGGWLGPERLRQELKELASLSNANFIHDRIEKLDLEKKNITTTGQDIPYDHLILATGSETNFYGNNQLQNTCAHIDTVADAVSVLESMPKKNTPEETNIVVVGGGYTGIEVASNLDILLKKNNIKHRTYIVEQAKEALMTLPEWMRDEVNKELLKLGIETMCGRSVKEYDGGTVTLYSGETFRNAVCIWAAGVKTPQFIEDAGFPAERSRVVVDQNLRPAGNKIKDVFVAGDTAYFEYTEDGKPLRMAVMFSMGEGKTAARNVINSIKGKPLAEYRPLDLGYLIPVANGNAPGKVLGLNIHGFSGYLMHYFMCIYRAEPAKRWGIIKDIFFKISKK